MTFFDLPVPPSANALFYNASKEQGGGRKKTKTYTKWIRDARWLLLIARARPVLGKVRVRIELSEKSGLDLDSCLKPSLDLLVAHGIIEDDQKKYIGGVTLDWSDQIDRLRITILPARGKQENGNALDGRENRNAEAIVG